jgi:hypothetical protein
MEIIAVGQRLARLLLPLFGVAIVLAGLIKIGRWTRSNLQTVDRYQLPFNAIDCETPPGQDRQEFLAEVQFLAKLPDRLPILEQGLHERLADAFARHPWVERVDGVRLESQRVEVLLRFRVPVLAVRTDGHLRAVDAHGILLPAAANTLGLPVFSGTASPPVGPAGTPWGDERVVTAARATAR